MKTKIKTPDGVIEKVVADKEHLQSQIKFPARVFKNKKKYNRKKKHRVAE